MAAAFAVTAAIRKARLPVKELERFGNAGKDVVVKKRLKLSRIFIRLKRT